MQLTKTCSRCNRLLPTNMFNQHKGNSDGLYSRCKDCKADENRKHAINRRERERKRALLEKALRKAQAAIPVPNMAMPRTFNHIKDAECWTGHTERMYVRNEGLKHIPSRGFV